jgi:subtilisin family serine protease
LAYLRALVSRRHDIGVYPAEALDRESPPEDMYLYRPAEILVPVDQIELFEVTARRLGIRYWPLGERGNEPLGQPRHEALGERGDESLGEPRDETLDEQSDERCERAIARFAVGANADLDTVLDRLVRGARGRLHVTPNHVLLTCPVWGLSPEGEPKVATYLPTPQQSGDAWDVAVAVIDGGLPEGFSANELLADVEAAPSDEELWAYQGPNPVLTFPQGHGSFVAGVVRLAAPQAQVRSYLAADQDGVTDEWYLGTQIDLALAGGPAVVNLSLGATSRHDESLMGLVSLAAAAIADGGPIVVAAAGNLDSDRPFWPAAEPWAIAVGAVEMTGDPKVPTRAWFSDHGPWVDTCAEGVDVVSAYEAHPYRPMSDPAHLRHFHGSAVWSGTSFATPRVAAAVAALRAADPSLSREGALSAFAGSGVSIAGIGTFVA